LQWQTRLSARPTRLRAPHPGLLAAAMDAVVATIKSMQRADPVAKEQWWAYCDSEGGGVRDPAKHDVAFLQNFIANYQSGSRIQASGGDEWAPQIKEFQRKSPNFKACWASYCETYGDGKSDPAKKSKDFIIQFIDFMSLQTLHALNGVATAGAFAPTRMVAPSTAGYLMPPAKRPRTDSSGGQAVASGSDPQKQALVDRIKTFQRADPSQKEAWGSHCDINLGGVRDPARHDAVTLQDFVDNYGVP